MTILLIRPLRSSIHYRQFWNWINAVGNKYDRQRVQELGADRVCAEWVVRCGGAVRFTNWGSLISNVKSLPTGTPGQFRIEEIRAVKASMTSEGFAYLDGLTNLKQIHLEQCEQIGDIAIARCNKVKDTLESVTLIDLVQISDYGLAYLCGLKNLKHLHLARLPAIKNRQAVLKLLKTELSHCTINYEETPPSPSELPNEKPR